MRGWDGQERRSADRLKSDFEKAKASLDRAQAHTELEKLHSSHLTWPPLVVSTANMVRKRAVLIGLGILVLVMAVVLVATQLLPIEKPQQAGDPAQDENRLYVLVNGARVDNATPVLDRDSQLEAEAQRWAKSMANDKNLRHRPNLRQNAPSNAGAMAENVAYNSNVEDMHARLMKSPGHRTNILNKRFTYAGMGAAYDDEGYLWVTQIFMEAKTTTAAPTTVAAAAPPTTKAPARVAAPPTTRVRC